MKFRLFFFALAAFIVAWMVFFKPFEIEEGKTAQRKITFENFLFKELTPQGKSVVVQGSKALAYDEKLLFYDVFLQKEDLRLSAKEGIYTPTKVVLQRNVDLNTSRFRIKTSKALYYLKAGIININSPFQFFSDNIRATGKRAVVDLRQRRMKAYKIKAKVKI